MVVCWCTARLLRRGLGTPAAKAAFPGAKVLAKSAGAKNPELRIDVDIRDPAFAEAMPELAVVPLEGVPFLDETMLFHRPTLFGADVALRADENDQWTWRVAARVVGCFKKLRVPPDVKKKIADKQAAARSLAAIKELPIERIVIAHGHVVDEAPLEQLLEAWRLVGV